MGLNNAARSRASVKCHSISPNKILEEFLLSLIGQFSSHPCPDSTSLIYYNYVILLALLIMDIIFYKLNVSRQVHNKFVFKRLMPRHC